MTGRERRLGERAAHPETKTISLGYGPGIPSTSQCTALPIAQVRPRATAPAARSGRGAPAMRQTRERPELFLDEVDPYSASGNFCVQRDQYAQSYRVVRALRVTWITRTRMIERRRDAVAAIMQCAWHDSGRAAANDAAYIADALQCGEQDEHAAAIAVDRQTSIPADDNLELQQVGGEWNLNVGKRGDFSARGRCVPRSTGGSASRAGGWPRWCRGPFRCRG
jgi:hypothetical protein